MSTTQNNTVEIDDVCDMLNNINTADNEDSICANCGKEGSDVTNTCNKCKSVKYCNAACKKKHRHKHKKECERRVAELHDEQLFKQPPKDEDCPICFLRLPQLGGSVYMSCCGKLVCRGCYYAVTKRGTARKLCSFCRTPPPTSDADMIKRYEKRMEINNDAQAMYNLGCYYSHGQYGLRQNHVKALKLWHRAAELGESSSYHNIGNAFVKGNGVTKDMKKALYYYELAAMGGHANSRHNLGVFEEEEGFNYHRALKHYMIAVEGGDYKSLQTIKMMYSDGDATKEDYAKALRSYQAYLAEIKSDQRDEAAASRDEFKYYSAF